MISARGSSDQGAGFGPAGLASWVQADKDRRPSETIPSWLRSCLVSAGPWPSAASPRASSALRIQRRRTNRGRSPGYGICKQWLNRGRGGLEDRLKRRSGRGFGLAGVAHDALTKRWDRRPDRHRCREIGPRSGESSGTSRGGCEAHGLCHDAAARRGLRYEGRPGRYPTTRRGRPGPGKYRDDPS